jgi:hypothetical protein
MAAFGLEIRNSGDFKGPRGHFRGVSRRRISSFGAKAKDNGYALQAARICLHHEYLL